MKKKSVIVSILMAIGFCVAILVCIYFSPKSSANLPDLVSIAQMDEAGVNKVLAGYYRNQLIEAWGEPDVSTVNEDIWQIGNDTSLLVSTNNKNKVVVCSISPQAAVGK